MKRILIIGPGHPYRGGLASYNERLAQQFIAEGHDVTFYTFTLQYPSFLFPGKTQYSTEPSPQSLVIERRVNSVNPFNWIKVGRMVQRGAYDMVIVRYWLPFMGPCLGTIARIARKNHKTKVLALLDNVIPHEPHFTDKILTSYFVRSVDGFVAMSKSVLADVERFDTTKPKALCPHPLFDNFGDRVSRDEALRFLRLDQQKRYMLFFGIIRDYKGLDLLLQAFADARLQNDELRLIVAGEFYNNAAQYFQQEKELGLEGRVIWFQHFVPDSEVKYYFNAADIIVQPYKSATQSGVTQIAYHFEKPMLVTKVGGLEEIVPDGVVGYAVNPDAASIADALVDFYDNDRQQQFEDNVRKEKEKYSWSRMTMTMNTLFDKA